MKISSAFVAMAVLAIGSSAHAAMISGVSTSPTKANGTFIAGSGIPGNDFTIDTGNYNAIAGPTTVEVALKAHGRQGLFPVTRAGNVYTVEPGAFSAAQPTLAKWNFAFQVSPGENGAIADGIKVFLDVDFNPAAGVADYATFGGTIPDPSFAMLGWNVPNTGSGTWSSDGVDLVVAGSENMGFTYWGLFGKSFNPNADGEYQINLRAQDSLGNPLATSTIFVMTPEPTSLSALALGSLVLRRRR